MPRYEFSCKDCGHEGELGLTISERNDPQVCPTCDSKEYHRGLGGFPKVLKASYPDGLRRKGYRELAEASRLEATLDDTEGYDEKKKVKHEINKLKSI